MSRSKPTDTLRLSDHEKLALVESLNAKPDSDEQINSGRTHDRVAFNALAVHTSISHPGGVVTQCIVTARNLSVGGLGFLHGGFVYEGTRVEMQLPTIFGNTRTIKGTVRSCRHINGKVHEIGVQFDREIDPYEFLQPGDAPAAGYSDDIDPATISGRVMLIDAGKADAMLLKHQLKDTTIELVAHTSFEDATDDIAAGGFDLLIIGDAELGANGGADTMQAVRMQSFDGPMLALTVESKPEWLAMIHQSGFSDVLVKPYDAGRLLACLAQHLSEAGSGAGGAIHSDLATSEDTVELLDTYLKEVQNTVKALHAATNSADFEKVRGLCQELKGTGQGYGYPRLSDAAKDVVNLLESDNTHSTVESAVKRLELIAQRLTSAVIPDAGATPEEDADE